jgi:hypothetical protein
MVRTAFFLATLGFASCALAQGGNDIYLCQDGEGNRTFKNFGDTKGCRKLDVQPILTFPAPKAQALRTAAADRSSSGPSNFPRVDDSTQRSRDDTRRQIIEDELRKEEGRLAEMERDWNGGQPEKRGDETRNNQKYIDRVQQMKDSMDRTRAAVAELRRELSPTRN